MTQLTDQVEKQIAQWRAFLRRIYAEERTPEKTL